MSYAPYINPKEAIAIINFHFIFGPNSGVFRSAANQNIFEPL